MPWKTKACGTFNSLPEFLRKCSLGPDPSMALLPLSLCAWAAAVLVFALNVSTSPTNQKACEVAHPNVRSVYISLLGHTPVPGQFWTVHDNITKQLGNVS